ncbi:MAG: DUF3298 and DUF4163 domain-containing protein [Pyrinomonadaceae bacterium]|nr:DUF3298 and DUF4163 domain-containing protein [Pyrinomonadaceae bacterium]
MKRIFTILLLITAVFIIQVFAQNGAKVFRGELGGQSIQMTLNREGKKLNGTYFYQKIKKDLRLEGTIDEAGNFTLTEFAPNGAKTGEFTGKWDNPATEDGASLTGNWINPKNKEESYFTAQEQFVEFTGNQKIETKSFAEKNKARMFEITAEYPMLSGGNALIAAKFNKFVEAEVMKTVNSFRKDMMTMTAADLKFAKQNGMSNYLELDYVLESANDRVISIGFYYSTFEGGAHPNHFSSAVNFDLKTGTVVALKDLFRPNANYLKTISALCIEKLKEDDSEGFDDEWLKTGAGPKAENFSSWNIKKKGILITFDPYQVASYAAGPKEVLLTYDELKSILKKDSVIEGMK